MPDTIKFPKIAIKNAVQTTGTLELLFLDYIYDTFDWETWTEVKIIQDVVDKVTAMRPAVIKITIDSEGGDCSIGLAFYNYITKYAKDNNATIIVEILAMCGSIASVMAMTASPGKLYIPRNAFMVIHEAWGWAMGRSSEIRQQADVVDAYTAQIVDIYAQRNTKGKTVDEIRALIAPGDYWMAGDKAIEMGFADQLQDDTQYQIAARIGKFDPHYRNIPVALTEQPQETEEGLLDKVKNFFTKKSGDMSFKAKIQAMIDSLTKEKKPGDIALDVANAINEPMNALGDQLDQELTDRATAIENSIQAKIDAALEGPLKKIQDLETANAQLQQELQDLQGKETTEEKPDNGPSASGRWGGKFSA